MQTINIETIQKAWISLNKILFIPHTDSEYQKLVTLLDNLIDEVGENEDHPLVSLMEIAGFLIENYEQENVPEL